MDMSKIMTFAAACLAASLAQAKVSAPSFVTDEALFWLDASTLDVAAGTELDSWADARGGSHPSVTTYTSIKPKVIEIADGPLAGKKAVTFFSVGTVCDMKFSADQNVRTAFFVVDIDQDGNAFLLGGVGGNGDAPYYAFHRGNGGAYFYGNPAPACTYWNDGARIVSPASEKIPVGYQLVTWRIDANITPVVNRISQDRVTDGRVGGKRLCEVIAFNRVLDDFERSQVEGYLKAKWYGADEASAAASMLFKKAQVHFDASVASSFHYDTEDPTKVVQWDDLSGNNNNFTPNTVLGTHYGTVSTVADKPVFDSGAVSSGIDLALAAPLFDTRTVIMVADVERNGNVFWLGDKDQYRFHRGSNGEYVYANNNNVYIRSAKGGQIWCNGAPVADSSYPENPGALSIYAFRTTQNCEWCYLGSDRNITERNGGKRVAELITFNFALSDSARKCIEDYLFEKWTPSEAYIDSIAAVHVDASSAANFNYADANITGWKNTALGNDLVSSSTYGSCGYTNGVTAFLMGRTGSGIDMTFDKITNIRAVFWAMDIQYGVTDAFFLGNNKGDEYHFHRGYFYNNKLGGVVGAYFAPNPNAYAQYGTTYCDGERVASPTAEIPPHGMHVFDLVSSANLTASSLSSDRNISVRNGGRAISELLILTNEVWGLTRAGVRRRMENKWTRKCGWAGAGDAEWGAGKYRVFDSDAVVPADGAASAGVGFTASATLSGGTLTLGDGGFFASEGVQVAVSAPVAGKLGVYGPGTVTLASSLATVDSIYVGYGSTLVLPANGTVVAGGLSMLEKAKLVLDVSALPAKQHASISFADCVLPAGGTLYDHVSLSGDTQGHVLTVSADGRTVHVNDPGVALSAEWNGGANDSATVAANWRCWNLIGEELPNTALPCFRTTNVVLNGDCDLRAWGTPVFEDGVRIDLNGRVLRVASLADDCFANAVVTNSNAGAIAELRVDVASGTRVTNSSASILGGVKLVKEGLGTYVAAKTQQTYSGGTTILEGVLENAVLDARNFQLGAAGSTITVSTNGANRGVFDIKGMYAQNLGCATYVLVMDGGLVQNTGSDVNLLNGQFFDVRLTADSEFNVAYNWGMFDSATTIDLGGHTLKVAIGVTGKIFHVVNGELKNGFIDVTVGGWFQTGVSGYPNLCLENVATNVDFRIASAMRILAPLSVRNYEPAYGYDANDGTGVFSVHGTFKPAAHDYFYGVTMRDGSTIDLSRRTSALPLTSSFTGGKKTIDFAENAKVTVDLSGREDADALAENGEYVVTWTESAAPGSDVTFSLDAASALKYSLKADGAGLRLRRNGRFLLIVR